MARTNPKGNSKQKIFGPKLTNNSLESQILIN